MTTPPTTNNDDGNDNHNVKANGNYNNEGSKYWDAHFNAN